MNQLNNALVFLLTDFNDCQQFEIFLIKFCQLFKGCFRGNCCEAGNNFLFQAGVEFMLEFQMF